MNKTANPTNILASIQKQEVFFCPACHINLFVLGDKFICQDCNTEFNCESNIPLFFWPNKHEGQNNIATTMKDFYEQNPFPNYENMDTPQTLFEKASRGIFARLLNEQIATDAKILEVGCGTGQLSNFLGLSGQRTIFASDMSMNSLKLGQNFKEKYGIINTKFIQMNLFYPVFKKNSFDIIICNGVLHHTENPFLGFKTIAQLVKKTAL